MAPREARVCKLACFLPKNIRRVEAKETTNPATNTAVRLTCQLPRVNKGNEKPSKPRLRTGKNGTRKENTITSTAARENICQILGREPLGLATSSFSIFLPRVFPRSLINGTTRKK